MPAEAAPAWEAAPAKVNLFLHVTGRRPDGYHTLDSLAVFAGAADLLGAEPADALTLEVSGPFGAALSGDNLALRAARALADAAGVPPRARLTLDKRLPVASGIGGGSADAAAALRLMSRLWGVNLAPVAMAELARNLGADVPVCLAGRAARMGGAGEVLSDAPRLPECGLALVNPGAGVATADVFRARSGPFTDPAELPESWPDAAAMAKGLRGCRNDLQPPALALCPAIGDVLAALEAHPGCLLARMSGSGATCFGLFAAPSEANAASRALARPGWWCWGGGMS